MAEVQKELSENSINKLILIKKEKVPTMLLFRGMHKSL